MMHLEPMSKPGKCPAHLRPWTAEDDELLINLYPSMKKKQVAIALGRTASAVAHRVSILQDAGRLPYKKPRLTPEQRRFIRDNRHTMTIKVIAAYLGVGTATIKYTARAMGVSYRKYGDMCSITKYPDSDVELIRQLRDEHNLVFSEISEKFDMHPAVCRKLYAHRLTAADAIAREYLPR
ncbi:AsnC family protein [Salmonella enterica]|nr:AsnC family protein [Salmonella enterica subsp. diarizonae serovar 48:i:z]EEH1874103.1 AsnC family protein [Salmonella enterica]EEM2739555.1 AsnC family protein [Salmonella enterica]EEN5962846.1 AsnC family protein [Salmonella enterica]EEP5310605.1 AsnC family protein [Salmonella enterica]